MSDTTEAAEFDAAMAQAETDTIDLVTSQAESEKEAAAISYFYGCNAYRQAPESPLYAELSQRQLGLAMRCTRNDALRNSEAWQSFKAIRAAHPRLGRALALTILDGGIYDVGRSRNMQEGQ